MRIGSFNIKDDYINRKGGIRKNGTSNSLIVSNIILKNNFDIIGCQELTYKFKKLMKKKLSDYKFYGNYRFGNLFARLPYNENNNIITNKKVIFKKTYKLPMFPKKFDDLKVLIKKHALLPRIATLVIFEYNDELICIINTHLNNRIPDIREKQLKKLIKIIDIYYKKYPIIITGDFNMEASVKIFKDFINNLEKYNLKHVDFIKNTFRNNEGVNYSLDHIFIPNYWKVKYTKIINSKGSSDHNYLCVDVEVKN